MTLVQEKERLLELGLVYVLVTLLGLETATTMGLQKARLTVMNCSLPAPADRAILLFLSGFFSAWRPEHLLSCFPLVRSAGRRLALPTSLSFTWNGATP